MTDHVICAIVEDECHLVGPVFAKSFADEPVAVATFNNSVAMEAYLAERTAAFSRFCCRYGAVLAIGDGNGGVYGALAMINMPAPEMTSDMRIDLGYPVNPECDMAMSRIGAMLAEAEGHYGALPKRWISVEMVAVVPDRQGQGLGSRLMRKVLDEAARSGEPVCLVTDRAINVTFYSRLGMHIAWKGMDSDGTVEMWSMRTFPEQTY